MARLTLCTCLTALCAGAVLALMSTSIAWADPTPAPPRLPVCGDQDDPGQPIIERCPDLAPLPNVQTFTASGKGDVELTFDFVFRQAVLNNELGFFVVDKKDGSVHGIKPGKAGYFEEAYKRAVVIFPSGSDPSTPDVTRTVPSGSILLFFIVQGDTLSHVRASNPDNSADREPVLFFSWDDLNPDGRDHFDGFDNKRANYVQFGFEDSLEDADYDDVVYDISVDTSDEFRPTIVGRGARGNEKIRNAALGGLAVLGVIGALCLYWFRLRQWFGRRRPLRTRVGGPSGPVKGSELVFNGSQPISSISLGQPSLEYASADMTSFYPLGEAITVNFKGGQELLRISLAGSGYMLHSIAAPGVVLLTGRPAPEWTRLQNGDEIQIGNHRIVFRSGSAQQA